MSTRRKPIIAVARNQGFYMTYGKFVYVFSITHNTLSNRVFLCYFLPCKFLVLKI